MRTAKELANDLLDFLPCTVDSVADIIRQAREEMREECARIALNEPRVLDHNTPDPQHRIEAKIRAIKNE